MAHELTHALGFSSSSMKNWYNQATKAKYVFSDIYLNFTDPNFGNISKLATPNVLSYARQYYGCPTLDGVPLEN